MKNNFTDTELANEVWRDIDGYDGAYQVSDLGRVRSKKYGYWRVLRPKNNGRGYLQICLFRDGKRNNHKVHRLVAQAFIKNDDDTKTQINHRDECKQNNRLWNLEYCTPQYNVTYNDIHHRRMDNYHRSNYKRDKVKDLYEPKLSSKENIEIFKANGIDCSKWIVEQLRKDLGLINKRQRS